MDWIQIAISIFSGLVVCIPLVVKLVQYITRALKEKQWNELLKLVTSNMIEAEKLFETGAERKEWCLKLLTANANSVGYPLEPDDIKKIGDLIDNLCNMAKNVNVRGNDND